jgi:hypothetical protein
MEAIKTEVHLCEPTVLKRIVKIRKVVSTNPTFSRIKAYPRRQATTVITFLRSIFTQRLCGFPSLFLRIRGRDLLRTKREQRVKSTPKMKGINPGPGLTKLPNFNFREPKATPKPSNNQIMPGIQSFCLNGSSFHW